MYVSAEAVLDNLGAKHMKPPAFVDCYGDLADALAARDGLAVPDLEVITGPAATDEEMIRRIQGRKNVLVYMGYLSRRVLESCTDLQTVAYLSTGVATHADLTAAAERGIRIEGVGNYGNRAVAEHAIALALAGLKRLAEMDRNVRAGRFDMQRSEEFRGKNFGVVGLGGIGRETASIAAALGARVIAWTRSGDPRGTPARMCTLDELCAEADILSLHLSLTPETERLLDAARFRRMKPTLVLVNTARAGLVDEGEMMRALREGRIAHAALDVYHEEPLPPNHPILSLPNVTLTPHSAWLTSAALNRLLDEGIALLSRQIAES